PRSPITSTPTRGTGGAVGGHRSAVGATIDPEGKHARRGQVQGTRVDVEGLRLAHPFDSIDDLSEDNPTRVGFRDD
ncbi:MAG TPA: hypothetical protein VKP69_06890, partial [Isosphaeraceae bacterium]|nr:hypothetical protein [Isosphaeraceae bacterium]